VRRAATRFQHPHIEPSRLGVRDLVSEAVAGIAQRPGRSILTALGTVLGVGAFVAVLGLTSTASGQIGRQFTLLEATTVTIDDLGSAQTGASDTNPAVDFPADADVRIGALHGVVYGGVYWAVPVHDPVISATPDGADDTSGQTVAVYAASPGALRAMQPTLISGTLYNTFHQDRGERVAVLGIDAARQLGITNLAAQPAVFVNDTAFTVVGVIGDVQRLPQTLLSVMIPSSTALSLYGPPTAYSPDGGGAHMLIQTQVGAADQIAAEAPTALLPTAPARLHANAPPDPHTLRDAVNTDLSSLFLLLAAVCLVIGALGIVNTTFVAVIERTGEIGLRRSLGARRRHVAAQFLAESAVLGTLGGLIGTTVGVGVVVAVAVARRWTALLDPAAVLPSPLIGSLVGLCAGLYPALRAARIEPLEALRR
jgi:putative ABC transport system permease protein